MARRRGRKQHNPHQLQCPHCKDKERWCKNLSGLTQHINAVHLDLFHTTTVDPPPHSPSSHRDSPGPLFDDTANGSDVNPNPPEADEEEEDDLDRDSPGVREPHPRLSGSYLYVLWIIFQLTWASSRHTLRLQWS